MKYVKRCWCCGKPKLIPEGNCFCDENCALVYWEANRDTNGLSVIDRLRGFVGVGERRRVRR